MNRTNPTANFKHYFSHLLFLTLLACGPSHASSDVHFHGVLYKISCVLNNDKPVDIAFGNVGVNKIDGIQNTQSIPLSITCDEPYDGTLLISVSGQVSDFDDSAVQTDISDLGIRLMQDGKSITINQPFEISTSSPPALTATPVARPGGELHKSPFTATATLIVEAD